MSEKFLSGFMMQLVELRLSTSREIGPALRIETREVRELMAFLNADKSRKALIPTAEILFGIPEEIASVDAAPKELHRAVLKLLEQLADELKAFEFSLHGTPMPGIIPASTSRMISGLHIDGKTCSLRASYNLCDLIINDGANSETVRDVRGFSRVDSENMGIWLIKRRKTKPTIIRCLEWIEKWLDNVQELVHIQRKAMKTLES